MREIKDIDRETIRIFIRTVLNNKSLFLKSLVYFVGNIGINVAVPFLISITLASIVTRSGNTTSLLLLLIVVAAIGIIGNFFGFANILRLNSKGQYDLLERAFAILMKRSVGFHTNNIGGKLVSNALEYPQAFGRMMEAVYINMAPFLLIMVIGILIVLNQSLAMGMALLVITSITLLFAAFEASRRSGNRKKRRQIQNSLNAHLSDTVVNAQAVKTFASEKKELHTHRLLSRDLLYFRTKDWTGMARFGSVRMGVLLALQIAFIAYTSSLIQHNPSILGIGIFAFSYTITLTNRLFDISSMIRNMEESLIQASSMTKILLQDIEITDQPNAKVLVVKKGEIRLSKVTFSYNDDTNQENVFKDLSFVIPAGQKVGLVGHSGGGKSTLTKLLLRFDDIEAGSIAIDGQNIDTVTQTSLRSNISYVPQEPLLFHRSIFDNIAYGSTNAKLAEVKAATKLAFADEFVDTLPNGYNTIVGERGVKLSGGQRQRVAIARAILKNAPILVLDEATSALDSESEVYIQKALKELMKDRTTIVIAHRLSTIQKMDRIIVLENGTIREDGSHRELLARDGIYSTLWSHQSGGFIKTER